jgi:flagellar hook-length control protein FliK
MSDMSILSNNAAASSKTGKQSTASANASDEAPANILPFGEVLARQLSDKTVIDVKGLVIDTQAAAKPLELSVSDVAIVATSDTKKIESNVDTTSANLPADLLATILPQTVAAAVAAVNISTQPSASGDKGAIVGGKRAIAVDQGVIANDKGTITSDSLKSSLNVSELAAPVSASVIAPKTIPTITPQVGTLTNNDKLRGATVAPESNTSEVALKSTPTIIAGKDDAPTTNIPSDTTYASEVNAGMITLKAAPVTTPSKDSVTAANILKGITESAEPNAGMIALKTMPTITTSKETIATSTKLKSVVDAPELATGKSALDTLPTINTNTSSTTKIVANVVAFAQEVELSDKLDASMVVPLTQAATPQANLVQSMANVSPIATQATQLVIDTPVTQKQWGNEFSQKITWMATQQDQHAELHLNPAQLGPVDVVIKVSGDQATAQFTSAHAAVREVIEQSIPKLREMLADNGIMLGNTTVSDQAPREQRGEFGNQRQTAPNGRVLESVPSNMSDTRVAAPLSRHNGMVDTFA